MIVTSTLTEAEATASAMAPSSTLSMAANPAAHAASSKSDTSPAIVSAKVMRTPVLFAWAGGKAGSCVGGSAGDGGGGGGGASSTGSLTVMPTLGMRCASSALSAVLSVKTLSTLDVEASPRVVTVVSAARDVCVRLPTEAPGIEERPASTIEESELPVLVDWPIEYSRPTSSDAVLESARRGAGA